MKYRYFYQTKTNETREGWVTARDRADAYATLRKQGIRPYRVIGDDPVRWQPWAIGALLLVITSVALTFGVLLFANQPETLRPTVRRGQLAGDTGIIAAGVANGWADVFSSPLDRHLAAYAQPGWLAMTSRLTEEELSRCAGDLDRTTFAVTGEDGSEVRQLKEIVLLMRDDLRSHLARGGTLEGYLTFLDYRQAEEIAYRRQAVERIRTAPEAIRLKVRDDQNVRLRDMGLPEIEE